MDTTPQLQLAIYSTAKLIWNSSLIVPSYARGYYIPEIRKHRPDDVTDMQPS